MYFAYPCMQKVIPTGMGLDALWFANMRTACYGSNTRQFLHHLLKSTQSQLRSNPVLADHDFCKSHGCGVQPRRPWLLARFHRIAMRRRQLGLLKAFMHPKDRKI